MNRLSDRFKAMLLLILLFQTAVSIAQPRYPMYPGYMPYPYAPPGQQPPRQQEQQQRQPANVQPQQRNYQSWPQTPYGRAPAQALAQSVAPQIITKISETTPYVQQTLLLTLQIISSSNLSSVNPEPPKSRGLIFKSLSGPVTSAITKEGRQQIVNEFRYAVTPIQDGNLTLPPFHVKGTYGTGRGNAFETTAAQSIQLKVKPVSLEVQPWLPLHGLILQSYVQNAEKPEAGKPLELVVDLSAAGATGSQLPSLEEQLQNTGFRIYRESSEASGKISPDGDFLLGHRTEIFTLVPLHGGKIQIPELKIKWWNVITGRPETSTVPIKQLLVRGEGSVEKGQVADLFPGASSLILWIPLIGVFGVTVGFWVLAWLRKKRFMQVVEEEIAVVAFFSLRQTALFLAWLGPIRRLQRLRQLFVANLPRSFRLWFCIRLVSSETDPEVWAYMIRFLANKHLGIPSQIPLPELGHRLAAVHPLANQEALVTMMQKLDAALYHDGSIDFEPWKRRFRSQLRPAPYRAGKRKIDASLKPHLPPLNPTV